MQAIRIDSNRKKEEILKEYLAKDETILHIYGVVPLDYRVANFLSPVFYISSKRLFFFFDEALEIYDLSNLDIDLIGDQPNFEIRKLVLENYPQYAFENRNEIEKLKLTEGLTKISINEPKQVPKYFLVRKSFVIQKSFKTWALYQLLSNLKNMKTDNETLVEMLAGYFSAFNQKTVVNFVFVFSSYVLLKIIFSLLLPAIFNTIIDVLFTIILVFFGYWLYLSSDKNFKRYYRYYLSYTIT